MVGQKGVSASDLHPSGWVTIKDQRVFVVSEGIFIEEGKEVEIMNVDGNRIVVREFKNTKKEGA